METDARRVIIEADARVIETLHLLLKRTPLKGEEVPDFVMVLNTLNSAVDKTSYDSALCDSLMQDSRTK